MIKKIKIYLAGGVLAAILVGGTAAYIGHQRDVIANLRTHNHSLALSNKTLEATLQSKEAAYQEELERWQKSMTTLSETMKHNQKQINNLTGALSNAKNDEKTKECLNFQLPGLVVDGLFDH